MVEINNVLSLDPWHLYQQMYRCRIFEKEVIHLWENGAISGEMHLSMGEEAVVVGVVDQLVDGDAMALDHRGTAPLLVRGVDPVLLMKEFMGRPDGLCGGLGGHMHLFSPEHLTASSGIVGAAGPTAVGFAFANQHLRPGKISVAFFGEGAVNQGMLLESFNLATAWKLPVMFVCKNNGMSLMTQSSKVTSGNLVERATSFGWRAIDVNGSDVEDVWMKVNSEITRLRNGEGPVFVLATCPHLEGHLLGDPFLRLIHPSMKDASQFMHLVKAHTSSKGASFGERTDTLKELLGLVWENVRKYRQKEGDPIPPLRDKLKNEDEAKLFDVENQVFQEMERINKQASEAVLNLEGGRP